LGNLIVAILSELTTAMTKWLADAGLKVQQIAYKDLIDGTINLQRPAIDITINRTKMVQKVTLNTYKWEFDVSIIVVFQNVKGGIAGEKARKEGIYELLQSLSDNLLLQRFGLPLENPLFPVGFRNITNRDLAKAGYQVYEINFWSSFTSTYTEPQDIGTGPLTGIVLKYWSEPDAGMPPEGDSTTIGIVNFT
jgi:hypothetical protein